MRVIISAGGTGGHIYPAISILNKIKEKEPSSEILYIGTTDRMESTIIPKLGIHYESIEMEGLNRKNILRNIIVLKKYLQASKKCENIIKEFKPDVVVGVGGYVTAPVIKKAHKLNIKTVIHEQNSIPGITNKSLSKIADKILISMPKSIKYFDEDKTVYTGNPRSEEVMSAKPVSKSSLGLSIYKELVVIVMGSLGSATITEEEFKMLESFSDKKYEVLLITGEKYFKEYENRNIKTPENVKVVPFLDNLISVLKTATLIVSRAGASTIAEITAIGLPAILVPSPYVTNNHQYKNALELAEKGACVILEEKDFNKEHLIPLIDKMLDNSGMLRDMSLKSKSLSLPDSAEKIYNEISKLVRTDN